MEIVKEELQLENPKDAVCRIPVISAFNDLGPGDPGRPPVISPGRPPTCLTTLGLPYYQNTLTAGCREISPGYLGRLKTLLPRWYLTLDA